jgi:sucrose-6-phosphate hydrolase SacC (GH32 family)
MWAWSWEHGRARQDIAEAGWAGALTFCRAVTLVGDTQGSRPAPELDGLRGEPLHLAPAEPFTAAAFDVELPPDAGRTSLWLLDDAHGQMVAEFEPQDGPGTPRILVDGSMVEIFDGSATAFTTRAYPNRSSQWVVRCDRPVPLRAWRLGL